MIEIESINEINAQIGEFQCHFYKLLQLIIIPQKCVSNIHRTDKLSFAVSVLTLDLSSSCHVMQVHTYYIPRCTHDVSLWHTVVCAT